MSSGNTFFIFWQARDAIFLKRVSVTKRNERLAKPPGGVGRTGGGVTLALLR